MKNRTSTETSDYWSAVEKALELAHLVAYDGCHKIYLAMDDIEAKFFRDDTRYVTFEGTPSESYDRLVEWYDGSCPLRFVNSVVYDEEDPNAGYKRLVPQGAENGGELTQILLEINGEFAEPGVRKKKKIYEKEKK